MRVRLALGPAAGGVGPEAPRSLPVEDGLGEDRAGRVAGAQDEDVGGSMSHGDLAPGGKRGHGRGQQLGEGRLRAGAVLQQEGRELQHAGAVGGIEDRAALAARGDEPRLLQGVEMRGHGVVRHGHEAGDVSGRQAIGQVARQQAVGLQPPGLGQCRERGERLRRRQAFGGDVRHGAFHAAAWRSRACSASQRSASSAAMQPRPAAVTAWRYLSSATSPAAKTPSILVAVESGAVLI